MLPKMHIHGVPLLPLLSTMLLPLSSLLILYLQWFVHPPWLVQMLIHTPQYHVGTDTKVYRVCYS